MPDSWTPPELGRAVERIELDVREIKTDIRQQGQQYVTRSEFETWRVSNDRELRDIKSGQTTNAEENRTAFAELRAELKSSSPPWWQIATGGIGAVTLIVLLAEKVAT